MAFPLDDRAKNAFYRESSFSLVHFKGNVLDSVPQLLDACGYRPLENATLRGPFDEVYWSLQDIEEPEGVVRKAVYFVPGGTVLLDPEMVVGFGYTDVLQRFCAQVGSVAVAAIWERVSETAALATVTPAGVSSRTYLLRGEPNGEQVNMNERLRRSPNPVGLREAIAALSVPVEAVFGEVEAWGLELADGSTGA